MKTELLPDVDFAEFDRKYEESHEVQEKSKAEDVSTEETLSEENSDLKWD